MKAPSSLFILLVSIIVSCTHLRPTKSTYASGEILTVKARGTFQSDGGCVAQLFWRLDQQNNSGEWQEMFTTPCCMTCGLSKVTYRNDTVSLIQLQPEASDFLLSELLTPGTYRVVAVVNKKRVFLQNHKLVNTRTFEVTDSVWIWR